MDIDSILRKTLIIRLACAAVIILVTLLAGFSGAFRVIILLIAFLSAGADLVPEIVLAIGRRDFLSNALLCAVAGVCCFCLGYCAEAVAMCIVYSLCKYVLNMLLNKSRADAGEAAKGAKYDINAGFEIRSSVMPILLLIIAVAVGVLVFLPMLAHYNVRVAAHRALLILVMASPGTILISMKVIGMNAIAKAADLGFGTKKATNLELAAKTEVLIFDRDAVMTDEAQHVLSIKSPVIDKNAFVNFVVHVVCNSDQSFARAILSDLPIPYDPELIQSFEDMPGLGVSGVINNMTVEFGTRELFADDGIKLPEPNRSGGEDYYLVLGQRYIGTMTMSVIYGADYARTVKQARSAGVRKCYLLCEADDVFPEFDELVTAEGDERYSKVAEICSSIHGRKTFVSAFPDAAHSPAAVDISTNRGNKKAEIYSSNQMIDNLSQVITLGKNIRTVAFTNSVIVFAAKALVVFLSIPGLCTLWLELLIENIAVFFTIFYSSRISSQTSEGARGVNRTPDAGGKTADGKSAVDLKEKLKGIKLSKKSLIEYDDN